jgi:MSHA biogenesis protein MshL
MITIGKTQEKRMRVAVFMSIMSLGVLVACSPNDQLAGFDAQDSHDRFKQLSREDFRTMHQPPVPEPIQPMAGQTPDVVPIPKIAEMLAAPRPPKLQQGRLVSIAVTDDVPLRDVLFELARMADVDIELGAGITGGINFRAKNKPFNEVIERIANLGTLRYSMRGGVLRVERDTPYIKNYSLDFLNIIRSSDSTITLTTDVLSASVGGNNQAGGGGGANNNSESISTGTSASVTATSESDLWTAFDASIAEILNYRPELLASSGQGGLSPGEAGYVINRQAGILSASATERQHDLINQFIALMKRNASAQVLIEAKIVEVTLNDEFRSGVNWDAVLERADFNLNFQPTQAISGTSGLTFALNEGNLSDIVTLTQQFGTSRTLSSPRLHAINNQAAVLTFAQNRIFFTCNQNEAESTTTDGGSTTTTGSSFQCEQGSVPIGILLTVLPSVNIETQEITLNVRPTLSRQVDAVADPGTAISIAEVASDPDITTAAENALAQITNEVPVIEVRELDSIMKLRDGGVMVIGGLLENVTTSIDAGVPGLSEIPWIGNAFKSRQDDTEKRELIIFIRAKIVQPNKGSYDAQDKRVYKQYYDDPRGLDL